MSSVVKLVEAPFKIAGNIIKGAVGAVAGKPDVPKVIQVPAPKTDVKKLVSQEEKKKKKRAAATQTVLTSPLGLTGSPTTKKPTLLGG